MHDAVQAIRYLNIAGYISLAGVALLIWRRRRDRAGMWAAAAFGSLGLLEILALAPNRPGNLAERALGRVDIALLVLFPFLLFRFTAVFRTARRDVANLLAGLTAILVVWTFLLPRIPQSGERWGADFTAFVAVFLLHWSVLSILAATRLALAGRRQPTVARRRMLMLSLGSGAITVAILIAVLGGSRSATALVAQILALLAAATFYLGLSPPALVRAWWRMPEQARLQAALVSLLTFAESREEIAARMLEPAAALVGARALAIRSGDGLVAGWNVPEEAWPAIRRGTDQIPSAGAELLQLPLADGALLVWTSRYAPFFGGEELGLLQTLGALTGVTLDRVRLYEAEREARAALERANEVKANFVALAAHELRTPMTTVHGFVTTLHHLSDRLEPAQQERIREALLQQTERMAQLIEQLLDLSRLDAEAIEIAPRPLPLRALLHEIVLTTAPEPDAVRIDVPDDLVVEVDPHAVERMVGNLVVNAFRYGAPPVLVDAERNDRHLRVTVEDRGSGVDPEFVPTLFERFTRSDSTRAGIGGTGLGLAIARSYAQAHGGDLVYEHAEPHGARFRIILPVARQRTVLPAADTVATL